MRGHTYLTSFVASLAFAVPPIASALAKDASYCVTCTGPAQTYLCQITGENVPRTDAMKLYCIVRTAKEGGHASCGAKNETAGCNGIPKVYAYDGPSLPAMTTPQQAGAPIEENIDEAFEPKARDGAPKTLVEATGRAYSASRRGIRNVKSRWGRGESEEEQTALQSPAASDSLPVSAASPGTLPELPGASPSPLTPLPSSMEQEAALVPHGAEAEAPPDEPGRIRRSAQSVGKFAKKSYRCVRTLFFKCRNEPQALGPE